MNIRMKKEICQIVSLNFIDIIYNSTIRLILITFHLGIIDLNSLLDIFNHYKIDNSFLVY